MYACIYIFDKPKIIKLNSKHLKKSSEMFVTNKTENAMQLIQVLFEDCCSYNYMYTHGNYTLAFVNVQSKLTS